MTKKKLKIKKSIARRFKVTKTGKVLRGTSFARHLRRNKSKSQLRGYKTPKVVGKTLARKVKKLLGVSL